MTAFRLHGETLVVSPNQRLRARVRARAYIRGVIPCAACDSPGHHTEAECVARRPTCTVPGCVTPTCIQARANRCPPTCLGHYFEQKQVKDPVFRFVKILWHVFASNPSTSEIEVIL